MNAGNRLPRILGVSVLVALGLAIGIPQVATSRHMEEVCRSCNAQRTTDSWGLGLVFGPGLFHDTATIRSSPLLEEIYGGNHSHSWSVCSQGDYFLRWRNGIACGDTRGNPVALLFATEDSFRAIVLRRLSDGTLRRQDLLAWLDIPDLRHRRPPDAVLQSPGYRLQLRSALAFVREWGISTDRGSLISGWEDALK